MDKITIFTPTFNRAYKLSNLYNSLVKQTSKEFVWLIIDDGSTDSTRELVNSWIKEKYINICYIFQENKGKMQAMNRAINLVTTDLFFCVDSDDFLLEDSINHILNHHSKIMDDSTIAGLLAYKVDNNLEPLSGQYFPSNIDITNITKLYELGISADLSIVFKSSVIKQYHFPILSNEKFMPENFIYSQIDMKYNYILSHDNITVCEYLEDGYSNNTLKLLKYNVNNYRLYWALKTSYEKNISKKITYIIRYDEFCVHSKKCSLKELTLYNINFDFLDIFLSVICWPISIFYYIIRKFKWRNL